MSVGSRGILPIIVIIIAYLGLTLSHFQSIKFSAQGKCQRKGKNYPMQPIERGISEENTGDMRRKSFKLDSLRIYEIYSDVLYDDCHFGFFLKGF